MKGRLRLAGSLAALAVFLCGMPHAYAQAPQPAPPSSPNAPKQQPQPQRQPQQPQQQQPPRWEAMPRMGLERQFAGPLRDTIVQRWRDPADGSICYIYLPITATHSPPTDGGYVSYGPNGIGSISCFAGPAAGAPRR
jgi:hypothetical protein